MAAAGRWRDHPARAELLRLYEETDDLVRPCSCSCATAARQDDAVCCLFGVTGREPYPTAIELCEVDHAIRARGLSTAPRAPRRGRGLPLVRGQGACPLLSPDGRCTIYASRPFGCRTFFCAGSEPPRRVGQEIMRLSRGLSDLAARHFPRDPLPRPLTRAIAGPLPLAPPARDHASRRR